MNNSVAIPFPKRSEIEEKIFQQWIQGNLEMALLTKYMRDQMKSISLLPADSSDIVEEDVEKNKNKEISLRNKKILEWLEKYTSVHDDKGKEWWDEFSAELQNNRFKLDRETDV
ncbi:MAG: hypothetical protein ABIH42_02770 [Planctomycetota bacterium]